MDKVSFFILNVFLNSLLAFFTVAFLIEGIIFLFRIPQGRIAAALRMIPIFKLPLDLCLYDFTRWSYAQGVNPLNCEEGTRTLSVTLGSMSCVTDWLYLPITSGIELTVQGNMTFTIADILGYTIKPEFLKIFCFTFLVISGALFFKRLIQYNNSIASLNAFAKTAMASCRKLRNLTLASCVKKYRFQILTPANFSGSPFVAGLVSSVVYIPEKLSQSLSRREYEAVLAHEIEHIRHKDSLVRLILDVIETIFWWVPTRWLHKRIEEGHEVGCDLNCKKYGVQPLDLASAICKSVRHSIKGEEQVFVHHLTKHTVFKRVNILLKPTPTRFRKMRFAFTLLAIGIGFGIIFLGRFWTF